MWGLFVFGMELTFEDGVSIEEVKRTLGPVLRAQRLLLTLGNSQLFVFEV
jgi:hypothetical protein